MSMIDERINKAENDIMRIIGELEGDICADIGGISIQIHEINYDLGLCKERRLVRVIEISTMKAGPCWYSGDRSKLL